MKKKLRKFIDENENEAWAEVEKMHVKRSLAGFCGWYKRICKQFGTMCDFLQGI